MMGQKCVECGKPSTVNIQKLWVKWKYDPESDEYSHNHKLLDIGPSDDENLHLCYDCMKLWEDAEI